MPLNNPSVSKPVKSSVATAFTITSSTNSTSLLAANPLRIGASIYNQSNEDLYIELGETASLTVYTVKVNADGYYEIPFGYTGIISGIWNLAGGNALVREFT